MKIARRNIRPGYLFERRIGFEPTNTGFADRPLKPLGHLLMEKICRRGRSRTYCVLRRQIYSLLHHRSASLRYCQSGRFLALQALRDDEPAASWPLTKHSTN